MLIVCIQQDLKYPSKSSTYFPMAQLKSLYESRGFFCGVNWFIKMAYCLPQETDLREYGAFISCKHIYPTLHSKGY